MEDGLAQAIRSQYIQRAVSPSEASHDVAAYLRTERGAEQVYRERVRARYQTALLQGTLIFRGTPTAAATAGASLEAAARSVLAEAAARIYPQYHLVNIRPSTDLAAKFLEVDRLDRMPQSSDPLGFVAKAGGKPRVDTQHPALAEALRLFRELLRDAQTGRLQGNAVQDRFAAAPYGWSKDATRYAFAALLVAGELVLYTAAGPVTTAGPSAVEALRNTQSFNRTGIGLRDSRPSLEALDRAATRLQDLIGKEVLPLESDISAAVRTHIPALADPCVALPAQLRLLGIAGTDRAQRLLETARDLVAQDGTAAIGILGMPACSFPADLEWAKAATAALDNGADQDIAAARTVQREADDLVRLFPDLLLIEDAERDTIHSILCAETFFHRLTDLRAMVRHIRDRVTSTYRDHLAACGAKFEQARSDVEQLPDWLQLSEEDRNAIAGRLATDLPEIPVPGRELQTLGQLLVRQSGIQALRQDLEREVARRVPLRKGPMKESAPDTPIEISIAEFASNVVLHSDADLQLWLEKIGAAIRNSMAAGAPVRIRVRP